MAVNPVQFLVASNASITDGSKVVNISGNVDCSRVFSGTAVFLGGADNPAEAVSGTSPDGSGNSTITLRNNWSQGDVVNQQMVTFNTNEGLAEAISNVREIVSNVSAIEDLATQGLIKRIDDNTYEIVDISAVGESLITANDASSQRSVLGLGSAATKNVGTASGNVMEVGAFGLGGRAKYVNNVNGSMDEVIQGGMYYGYSGTHPNATPDGNPFPDKGGAFSAFVFGDNFGGNDYGLQLAAENTTNFNIKGRSIGSRATGFSEWETLYHSGNSVNPLDYGVGIGLNDVGVNIGNFATNKTSGLYRTVGGEEGTPLESSVGSVINLKRGSTNSVNQIYVRGNPDQGDGQMYFRGGVGSTFTDWFELYHSGNTNFNEFGGNGNECVATGEVVTSTIARFYLPINSKNKPLSLSIVGSFNVFRLSGSIVSGAGAGSIALSAISSPKMAVIDVIGSGLTLGEVVNLRCAVNNSKITVNF